VSRLRVATVGAVVLGLVATACSPTASTSPSDGGASPAISAPITSAAPSSPAVGGGGNLAIVSPFEPSGLYLDEGCLTHETGKHGPILRNVLEALVGRDPASGELVPMLAESWESVDANTWRFTLRQDVVFHDGAPFNAEAAAASLARDFKPDLSVFVGSPTSFTAVDDFTLEAVTETPDPLLPGRLANEGIWGPAQAEDEASRNEHPVGTGPYAFVSWERGSKINLELYEDYWRANPGMFDTVEWIFRAENSVRGQMIEAGEADIALELTADQCDSGAVECVKAQNISFFGARVDKWNQTLLGDQRVSRAVAHAINRKALADAFINGGEVIDNPGPPGSYGYDENIVGYDYDPEAARALLEEAKADGIDTSIPVRVATADIVNWADIAQAVSADLQAAGFNANFEAIALEDWFDNAAWLDGRTREADMAPDRNTIWLSGDSNELFDLGFHAGRFYTCDAVYSGYCNPEVDALYTEGLALTGDERSEVFKQMWRLAYDDVPFIPISLSPSLYAVSDRATVTIGVDTLIPLWLVGAPN
jgi:peptide/nickel transport system substrate-binding protein